MLTFGEKLKALRKQKRKSQADVETEIKRMMPRVKLSQSTLSALEYRRLAPREATLLVLAEYYNVPTSYFLFTGVPISAINSNSCPSCRAYIVDDKATCEYCGFVFRDITEG